MLVVLCAILLFLWAPVSARILALVFQIYERKKLKLKLNVKLLFLIFVEAVLTGYMINGHVSLCSSQTGIVHLSKWLKGSGWFWCRCSHTSCFKEIRVSRRKGTSLQKSVPYSGLKQMSRHASAIVNIVLRTTVCYTEHPHL